MAVSFVRSDEVDDVGREGGADRFAADGDSVRA
jgi:hypothetical protein